MELYGYLPHPYANRSPTNQPRSMHSTLSFPGSSGRRGSVPLGISNGISDVLGSPASLASARVPQTPNNRVQPSVKSGTEESPKRPRTSEKIARARKRTIGPDAQIEEQLFPQLNSALSNLAELDNEADNVVSTLEDALASAKPALSAKTSHIIHTHREKIAQTESTSSPWRDLARIASEEQAESDISEKEEEEDEMHDPRDGERRILRLDRRRRNGSMGIRDGGDGSLEKVKGWAEEVKNYLTSEIMVLNARQEAGEKKGRKWSLVRWITSAVLILLLSMLLPWSRR